MAETKAIINTLKTCLKEQQKTYTDVARALQLSEASVKRLFSEQSFSLERLDKICELLDFEVSDLVLRMRENEQHIDALTEEQEKEIADDLALLLVTVCVLNRQPMANIVDRYQLKDTEVIQKLAKLDRLKIIELLPGNRVKLLVSPHFRWLENGPILRFFQSEIEKDFFASRFDAQEEQLTVVNAFLSKESNLMFQQKMKKLAKEFMELSSEDQHLPPDASFGTTAVLAVRQWRYSIFSDYNTGD